MSPTLQSSSKPRPSSQLQLGSSLGRRGGPQFTCSLGFVLPCSATAMEPKIPLGLVCMIWQFSRNPEDHCTQPLGSGHPPAAFTSVDVHRRKLAPCMQRCLRCSGGEQSCWAEAGAGLGLVMFRVRGFRVLQV